MEADHHDPSGSPILQVYADSAMQAHHSEHALGHPVVNDTAKKLWISGPLMCSQQADLLHLKIA